nr:hypothetical protein [Mycobacterium tilburgii]
MVVAQFGLADETATTLARDERGRNVEQIRGSAAGLGELEDPGGAADVGPTKVVEVGIELDDSGAMQDGVQAVGELPEPPLRQPQSGFPVAANPSMRDFGSVVGTRQGDGNTRGRRTR